MSFMKDALHIRKQDNVLIISDDVTIVELLEKKIRRITANVDVECIENRKRPIKKIWKKLSKKILWANLVITCFNSSTDIFDEELVFRKDIFMTVTRKSKARLAHMVGVGPSALNGIIEKTNYTQLEKECSKFGEIICYGKELIITSKNGTNLYADIGRWDIPALIEDGNLDKPNTFCNLPAGEVCVTPKSINGEAVIDGSFNGIDLKKEKTIFKLNNSHIVPPITGGATANTINNILFNRKCHNNYDKYQNIISVGEIGFGLNPIARLNNSRVEDEKVYGTVHLAFGQNIHIGGNNIANYRYYGVITKPTVKVDGITVIRNGQFIQDNYKKITTKSLSDYNIHDVGNDSLIVNQMAVANIDRDGFIRRMWATDKGKYHYSKIGNNDLNKLVCDIWQFLQESPHSELDLIAGKLGLPINRTKKTINCMREYGLIRVDRKLSPTEEAVIKEDAAKKVICEIFKTPPKNLLFLYDDEGINIMNLFKSVGEQLNTNVESYCISTLNENQELPDTLLNHFKNYDAVFNIIGDSAKIPVELRITLVKTEIQNNCAVVHCPGIHESSMLWSVNIDYEKIQKDAKNIIDILSIADEINLTAPSGTNLTFSIKDRIPHTDLKIGYGEVGNIPAGEVFIAPIESSANGLLVVDGSISHFGAIGPVIKFDIKNGIIQRIYSADVEMATRVKKTLLKRRMRWSRIIGEFGIGLNNKTLHLTGNPLEDEKALHTCHIAFGYNIDFGGINPSSEHMDCIIYFPTVQITTKKGDVISLMRDGRITD